MKILLNILLILVMIGVIAWAVGVKLFVIKPGTDDDYPDGATLVILSHNDLRFVDSPEGVCQRLQGGAGAVCTVAVVTQTRSGSTQLVPLPYIGFLYSLTDAPKAPAAS